MVKSLLKVIGKFILFNLKIIYVTVLFLIILFSCVSVIKKDTSKNINTNYNYVIISTKNITDDKYDNTQFFDDKSQSFKDFENKLEKVRLNKNVKAIILNLNDINLSSSQIEELSKILIKFPNSNKKIYAYGDNINNSSYKLASYADEIIMPNTLSARLSLNGYYHNSLYFKDLLDRFGIKVEALHVGSHKSYGEQYYLNKMSNELKENNTRLLENRFQKFVELISKNRSIDKSTIMNNIISGKYDSISAYTAKDLGLIDNILDFDDLLDNLSANDLNTVNINDIEIKEQLDNSPVIAIVPLEGPISSGATSVKFSISELSVREKLSKIENNKKVKAVILRINSPGGEALEAEKIYKLIKRFIKKTNIPVYASLSDVAASGGYYIATSASKIYANNATLTGSIGVVSLIPKFDKTLAKFSVNKDVIEKGKFTGIYDPTYSLTNEDRDHIIDSLNDVYIEFKHRVSQARNITDEKLEPIAGGRVWLGDEAKNIGLVDDIASLNEVIDIVAKDVNIKNYNVIQITSKLDFNNYLDKLKSSIIGPQNIKIYDEVYKKLIFINENSYKALFFNDGLNNIKY